MNRLSLIALIVAIGAGPASADALLGLMREQVRTGPIYAYEMQYVSPDVTATGKIDPSQPEGERITVYSPPPESWSDDFKSTLEKIESEATGDIWCAEFADSVPATASLKTQTETAATYAFTPIPDEDSDKNERKLMKKMAGEITLDKSDGAILGYQLHLPQPFKPAIIAKINTFELAASCARAPDGRTYLEDFTFAVSGSAMMQAFSESAQRRITALLDPVG